jgi:hypothetical protein
LDDIIANLNLLLKPDLCVVDGLVGRDIQPVPVGILLVSTDPVATDATAAQTMGLSPRKVHHLMLCSNLGIGKLDGIKITVDGLPVKNLSSVQKQFKHMNIVSCSLVNFGYWLSRMANRISNLGGSVVTLSSLSGSASLSYTKREILRMLVTPSSWRILWELYQKSK